MASRDESMSECSTSLSWQPEKKRNFKRYIYFCKIPHSRLQPGKLWSVLGQKEDKVILVRCHIQIFSLENYEAYLSKRKIAAELHVAICPSRENKKPFIPSIVKRINNLELFFTWQKIRLFSRTSYQKGFWLRIIHPNFILET